MSKRKYFGTDGIRNRLGQGLISPDLVLKLGWATGYVMKQRGLHSVLMGKDTRISGYMFESALEAGLISAGVDVYLVGPMPTPAVSYLTQTFSNDMGIVISASHNPHEDNGIKFFDSQGQKISDEMEIAIEEAFEMKMQIVDSEKLGKAKRIDDAAGRYIEFCKGTYRAKKKFQGLRIVLDCAHGATYHIAPSVFKELGAEVFTIGDKPNGININQNCGATHLATLKEVVVEKRADIGIAFDGDGDRVMMVDSEGRIADGDVILFILATMTGKVIPGVVGTVMSNLGLENKLKSLGVAFERSAVGDRFVKEILLQKNWRYGAEPSGHVLCLDKIATGDGIVAALQVMAALISHQKQLSDVIDELVLYPQELRNITVANNKGVEENTHLQNAIVEAEKQLGQNGRILIRASGTEPKIRVMVEGKDLKQVKEIAEMLEQVVESEFS